MTVLSFFKLIGYRNSA